MISLHRFTLLCLGALISSSLPERTAKQCRERYHNHLATDIKKTDWSQDEDLCVIILQKFFGNQWAKVKRSFVFICRSYSEPLAVSIVDIKINARTDG
jgi:hypothetical protein